MIRKSLIKGTLLIWAMLSWRTASADERQRVIVVIGASGTEKFGQMFSEWADLWETAAVTGDVDCDVIGRDSDVGDRQRLQQLLAESTRMQTIEPLWLVLIGHGTFDGRTARFNMRGRDISAAELAELLAESQRPVAVVNCASCSAPFINALSGPDRVIVTGTKDGSEIQFARFGGFLAEAIGKLDADIDRDGQTSLLEAWLFAARRTAEYYESDGRLATEHSLLDDSTDSKGTRFEVFEGVRIRDNVKNREKLDGKLARQWHFVRSDAERSLTPDQRVRRNQLEEDLEKLRKQKTELSEAEYLRQLEHILLPMARLYESAEAAMESSKTKSENNP